MIIIINTIQIQQEDAARPQGYFHGRRLTDDVVGHQYFSAKVNDVIMSLHYLYCHMGLLSFMM
jgi:hypothetical protein